MIRAIIVEDEDNSRDLLIRLIERYCPDIHIIGTAASVIEAVDLIQLDKPDLVFMDIHIIGGTGFDVLNKVNYLKMGFIFITGYDQFALKALKYSAVDYLLKPVDFEELIDSVKKYKESVLYQTDERLSTLKINYDAKRDLPTIAIPSIKGFRVFNLKDISWINSEGSYSTFKIQKEQVVASKPIGYFEEILPTKLFYRIHNRTIVNVSYISEYRKGKGGTVLLTNGDELTVSERIKDGLLRLLIS